MKHPWVILYDIDGTLLTVNRNFNRALLRELLDELNIHYPEMEKDIFSGRTDHDIFSSFLVNHDFDPELYSAFKQEYLKRISTGLGPHNVRKHGFVDEVIQFFSADKFMRGMLTGNYPVAAEIKLKAAGIELYYEFGAFGEDEKDRNRLPFTALREAEKLLGFPPDAGRFVVLGDTPRDIICAKGAGMKCVAVATGSFTEKELAAYEPDLIIGSLANPEIWFKKIV